MGLLLNACGEQVQPFPVNPATLPPTRNNTQTSPATTPAITQISTTAISSTLKAATPSAGLPTSTPGPASLKLVYTTPEVAETVGSVRAIAFSPDGQIISTGTDYGVIILRETRTGKEIRRFQHNFAEIQSLAFSPDGKELVSGNSPYPFTPNIEPGLVILWEVSSGKLLKIIGDYSGPISSVVYRADSKILATGGGERAPGPNNGGIRLWKIAGEDLYEEIPIINGWHGSAGYFPTVSSVAFSPDGNILASSLASADNSIILWDTSSLATSVKAIRILSGYTGGVAGLAFSPDGKILASANGDKSIKLWQISNGSLLATFTGHSRPISTINYSPDGKVLATTSLDQTLKLWRITNSGGHEDFSTTLSNIYMYVTDGIAFSPDGKHLATGNLSGLIKLWEVLD